MKKIISALLMLTMLVSMVCVSTTAAGVHVNMNFESMEVFTSQFTAGAFYTEDNLLFGYAEAKALQTHYGTDPDYDVFDNTGYTWLTYDTTITLSAADDDLSESDRYVNLIYCNDNLVMKGREENRMYMSFMYDFQEGCFRLAKGYNATSEEDQILSPVYKEINTDGSEFYTMGISVDKDRIRCFYNNELIFDFQDTARDYLIADEINSCFLFWQDGNFVQISNVTVADQGYLFPYGPDPVSTETQAPTPTDGPNPGPTPTDGPTPTEGPTPTDGPDVSTTPKVTTTSEKIVDVTDKEGNTVTDEKGEKVTSISIVTEPAPAATNTGKPAGGSSTATGDATFVVVAVMVATLGAAIIIRKVNAQ